MISAKIVVVLKTFQPWTITLQLMPPVHTVKVAWLTLLYIYMYWIFEKFFHVNQYQNWLNGTKTIPISSYMYCSKNSFIIISTFIYLLNAIKFCFYFRYKFPDFYKNRTNTKHWMFSVLCPPFPHNKFS